jgi:hypothetical protein
MNLAKEVAEAIVRVIAAIAAGDTERAANEARIAAETVASKRIIDASYEAGVKARG